MTNSKPAAKSRRGAYPPSADEWRNLASEFLRASDRYIGKDGDLRLVYKKASSEWPEGFVLIYVESHPSHEGEGIEDPETWAYPTTMESTFRNLAARGLRLAGRPVGPDVWRDWARFLAEVLPWHQQEIEAMVGSEIDGYLESIRFRLVDESVRACQELEFKEITGREPEWQLYARGLRAFRNSRYLSQEGFAELAERSRKTVSGWENNHPIIPADLDRICRVFKCSRRDILNEPSTEPT